MIDLIVPSAGPLPLLETCLQSLAAAMDASGADFRATVVDDDTSRTGVGEVARRRGFEVVVGPGLSGGAARNRGADVTDGEWLLFVDDDVVVAENAFIEALRAAERHPEAVAVMGGLTPPPTSPVWLVDTFATGVFTPSSSLLGAGWVPPESFGIAITLVRRSAYEGVGGLPVITPWGPEDALFGRALDRAGAARIWRAPTFSGIHQFIPTWAEWLARCGESGRRLAELERELPLEQTAGLAAARNLSGTGWRARAKGVLGRLPLAPKHPPPSLLLARMAASAAESRGYRQAAMA